MARSFAPVETYRGYTIWHYHPHGGAEWCATGSDGTVWFGAESYEVLCAVLDQALDEA